MTIPNDETRSMGPGASQPAPGAQTAATGSSAGETPRPPQWEPRGVTRGHKSPVLAALLSMLPGLGQIYLGDYNRGFLYGGIFALLVTACSRVHGGMEPLFGISVAFFSLYNIIDAARRASLYNQAMAGIASSRPSIPEDFKLPSGRGSLFWGAVICGIGLILLLNTRFDIDFDWLEDWWPAFIVLIGLNMLYRAVRNR